ncbi:MAG TPA: polyprenol monophosphomannose synthase [Actinobacteria bacterium]|nr:polyprenol monophosphomannose synthase [Actinomycetota bacterium]
MDLAGRLAPPVRRLDSSDVVVVVPTYNEAENLPTVAGAIRATGFRLLVVDDASPDGTGTIADQLSAADPDVEVLHRAAKEGLGPAYVAGFERAVRAGARVVCQMDADLSHDPADLPRLVEALDAGADLAIGSRYVPGGGVEAWSVRRRLLSRGGNLYASMLLGLGVRDATAGFRAWRVEALERIDPASCEASGYGFQIEMTLRARRAGLEIAEVPILFRDREEGTSKMSSEIALEAMRLVTRWGLERLVGRSPSPRAV